MQCARSSEERTGRLGGGGNAQVGRATCTAPVMPIAVLSHNFRCSVRKSIRTHEATADQQTVSRSTTHTLRLMRE
jgi:hypothetical protein